MKTKLTIVMVLIGAAILGIITLQGYWTASAYSFNKTRFDYNIDTAMARAMDDCKKDYFDSMRVVFNKRLSSPSITIKVDTIQWPDSLHEPIKFSFSTINDKFFGFKNEFSKKRSDIDYYRQKFNHKPLDVWFITKMAFYEPELLSKLNMMLGIDDMNRQITQNVKADSNDKAAKSIFNKLKKSGNNSIYALPVNVRAADSLKLAGYLKKELQRLGIRTSFGLKIDTLPEKQKLFISGYSETNQYAYQYHGFVFLHIVGPVYYIKAVFNNPLLGVLKGMWLSLVLSGLLLLFMLFCFFYIVRTLMQQKKLSELKDDFISNMAHELKTPLATMTVAIEGLQNFNALKDPDKTQRYLQTSREQISHLNILMNKVLDTAAYEKGNVVIHKTFFNPDKEINQVINAEQLRTGQKATLIYKNNGLAEIYADEGHFKNVMINLIENAVKYANHHVSVKIDCYMQNNQAVITVQDNGIGIPLSLHHQIFDKFYRVPTGNLHNVKGTGLGLNYVKTIIDAHGGNITVKSEPDKGSTFTVYLPLTDG